MKSLITVQELAKVLKVPASWIYQRTSMGQKGIPHVKMGKYVRFDADEVIRFLRSKDTSNQN